MCAARVVFDSALDVSEVWMLEMANASPDLSAAVWENIDRTIQHRSMIN